MIRANVYSVDTLDEDRYRAIEEGLDLFGGYIGQTVASRAFKVRLPQDDLGRVNPRRVGVGKLDKMVELHLMAVPLSDSQNNGVAFMGTGVAFVSPWRAKSSMAHTAAHEAAHALGFLRADSLQRDIHSGAHCCSPNCIMHKSSRGTSLLLEELEEETMQPQPTLVQKLSRTIGLSRNKEAPSLTYLSDDFCSPCQRELSQYGEEHLGIIRMERLTSGQVSQSLPAALKRT